MGKTLILTEKPSVAKDFAKALGISDRKDGFFENGDYVATWAIGHLVELYNPEDYDRALKKWDFKTLPIIPNEFKYKPVPGTAKQYAVVRDIFARKDVDRLVIATDAGREGEVIARTIMPGSFKGEVLRFWSSQSLTPEVIKEEMGNLKPASVYDRLWEAGQARQLADWLVGINGSRAATVRMCRFFTIGRVQTAVVSLLADRHREREEFKSRFYWPLTADFSNGKGQWRGTWFSEKEKHFTDEKRAKTVKKLVRGKTGKVISAEKTRKSQPPPLLYSLTDLQQDANRKCGFSAQKTLDIAQALYESGKCLSYPRTDSRHLGADNVRTVELILQELSSVYNDIFAGTDRGRITSDCKRIFDNSKLTDHHALIPLAPLASGATPDPDEEKVYDLVMRRFAAAFHPDFEYEQTEIVTEAEKAVFRTAGRVELCRGWKAVYETDDSLKKKDDGETGETDLPPLVKGDEGKVTASSLQRKKTTPPPEYSEALLLGDMMNPGKFFKDEELDMKGEIGLGTQATRAGMIETVLKRGYAGRKGKHLIVTDKGIYLIATLRKLGAVSSLTSPDETARWEMQLDSISRGDGSSTVFLNNIKEFVRKMTDELEKADAEVFSICKCPACDGGIVEGGKAYGCSNWNSESPCKFVIWKEISGREISEDILMTLVRGEKAGPFKFRSQKKKDFEAFLKLVEGDDGFKTEFEFPEKKSLGKCPLCGGSVTEFEKAYGCSNWNSESPCKFVIWKEISGREISLEIVGQLLEGGKTENLDGFVSKKNNKKFSTILTVNSKTGRIDFDFSGPK